MLVRKNMELLFYMKFRYNSTFDTLYKYHKIRLLYILTSTLFNIKCCIIYYYYILLLQFL